MAGRTLPAFSILLALLAPVASADVDCADYSEFMHWLPHGDPDELWADRILVEGGYAYLYSGDLLIFDLSDPDSPQQVAALAGAGTPVDKVGDSLVCAGNGIQLVDISDPTSPALIGSAPERVNEIAADGDLAIGTYRTGFDDYIRVFALTGPGAPAMVAELFVTTRSSSAVEIEGSLAFVSYLGSESFLQPIDLSRPASPVLLAPVPESIGDMEQRGDRLYVIGGVGGGLDLFRVLDISNPSQPALVGSVEMDVTGPQLTLADTRVYVCDPSEFYVIDIENETAPDLLGGLRNRFETLDVGAAGDRAYVVGYPTEFDGGYQPAWLRVADVGVDASATPLGVLELNSYATRIATQNGLACAVGNGGLIVVDIADPLAPVALGSTPLSGDPKAILLAGAQAYVLSKVDGYIHLLTVDVSDPYAPTPLANLGLTKHTGAAFALRGDLLYLALADVDWLEAFPWLGVVDVSDPTAPLLLGTISVGPYGHPRDLHLSDDGGYLFYVKDDYAHDVAIFDLADPEVPMLSGYHDVEGLVRCGGGSGDLLVTSGAGSLWGMGDGIITLLDISDPPAIETLSSLRLPSPGYDILIGGSVPAGYFYLSSFSCGLTLISARDPQALIEVGSYNIPTYFMADGGGFAVAVGIKTLPFDCVTITSTPAAVPRHALVARPNPFNPSTTLHFSLREAGPVRIMIHDLSGREVRLLHAGEMPAGASTASWNGCDNTGRPLASGVYLAHLNSREGHAAAKLLLLK